MLEYREFLADVGVSAVTPMSPAARRHLADVLADESAGRTLSFETGRSSRSAVLSDSAAALLDGDGPDGEVGEDAPRNGANADMKPSPAAQPDPGEPEAAPAADREAVSESSDVDERADQASDADGRPEKDGATASDDNEAEPRNEAERQPDGQDGAELQPSAAEDASEGDAAETDGQETSEPLALQDKDEGETGEANAEDSEAQASKSPPADTDQGDVDPDAQGAADEPPPEDGGGGGASRSSGEPDESPQPPLEDGPDPDSGEVSQVASGGRPDVGVEEPAPAEVEAESKAGASEGEFDESPPSAQVAGDVDPDGQASSAGAPDPSDGGTADAGRHGRDEDSTDIDPESLEALLNPDGEGETDAPSPSEGDSADADADGRRSDDDGGDIDPDSLEALLNPDGDGEDVAPPTSDGEDSDADADDPRSDDDGGDIDPDSLEALLNPDGGGEDDAPPTSDVEVPAADADERRPDDDGGDIDPDSLKALLNPADAPSDGENANESATDGEPAHEAEGAPVLDDGNEADEGGIPPSALDAGEGPDGDDGGSSSDRVGLPDEDALDAPSATQDALPEEPAPDLGEGQAALTEWALPAGGDGDVNDEDDEREPMDDESKEAAAHVPAEPDDGPMADGETEETKSMAPMLKWTLIIGLLVAASGAGAYVFLKMASPGDVEIPQMSDPLLAPPPPTPPPAEPQPPAPPVADPDVGMSSAPWTGGLPMIDGVPDGALADGDVAMAASSETDALAATILAPSSEGAASDVGEPAAEIPQTSATDEALSEVASGLTALDESLRTSLQGMAEGLEGLADELQAMGERQALILESLEGVAKAVELAQAGMDPEEAPRGEPPTEQAEADAPLAEEPAPPIPQAWDEYEFLGVSRTLEEGVFVLHQASNRAFAHRPEDESFDGRDDVAVAMVHERGILFEDGRYIGDLPEGMAAGAPSGVGVEPKRALLEGWQYFGLAGGHMDGRPLHIFQGPTGDLAMVAEGQELRDNGSVQGLDAQGRMLIGDDLYLHPPEVSRDGSPLR